MNFVRFGNSKNFIVFLHGWGADLNSFLWLKDYFEDDYSLLFLDFEGFGKSEIPSFSYSVSDYVCSLKNLLDNFEIEKIVFVAHSFGGRVAIKFLFFYQNLYSSVLLCLVDSAGILPRKSLLYKIKVARYKCLAKKCLNHPELKYKLDRFGSDDYKALSGMMKQIFVKVVNEDLSKYLKFIKVKTLIVWGENDRETKMYMARKFRKLISDSRLVVFKNCGHFSFLENKEDFVIVLDTFLKNL